MVIRLCHMTVVLIWWVRHSMSLILKRGSRAASRSQLQVHCHRCFSHADMHRAGCQCNPEMESHGVTGDSTVSQVGWPTRISLHRAF